MSDRDTIERAIRHIDSCLDVDPWAMEIAVGAMKKQIPMKPTETTNKAWGIDRKSPCVTTTYHT